MARDIRILLPTTADRFRHIVIAAIARSVLSPGDKSATATGAHDLARGVLDYQEATAIQIGPAVPSPAL
jgi:hypothetical protein